MKMKLGLFCNKFYGDSEYIYFLHVNTHGLRDTIKSLNTHYSLYTILKKVFSAFVKTQSVMKKIQCFDKNHQSPSP